MPGPRLRAHSQANPISATLLSPLNARPTNHHSLPHCALVTPQPAYPGASPDLDRSVAAAGLPQGRSPSFLRGYDPKDYFTQSPFRNRAASSAARRLPHLSAARLWNPTNSTPRLPEKTIRKRRPSTPPPPAVPLSHPTLDPYSVDPSDPLGIGAGDYPLLTLPEQRQTRHSTSNRASLQLDRNAEHRISLPPSVRHSYDGRRSADPSPTFQDPDSGLGDDKGDAPAEPPVEPRVTGLRKRGQSVSNPLVVDFAYVDKGKGKAIMEQTTEAQVRGTSKDLERGPDVLPRISNVSAGDGIGSAISSSNSSIMGEELPPDLGEEWGPQHPCFPHLNPHVPIDSPEYHNTRIIRIRRDWLLEGDLAPTFSNLYPEILDPAGLSEQEFRRIIDRLNGELVPIFSPYNWRNIMDSVLGLVTGWLWDDLGFTGVKARLKRLERWVDQWNNEMEKTVGNEDPSMAPRIISLRRTGYMTLDIQIPDPEIAPAPSTPTGSGNMPMEPPAAVTA
ncbi:Ras modification protein ERF4 [Colletotrichum aenigma]|uniref:Ras modification protein ERF4 n=1 Tax=Colletotrichum aenigma TaxID=1215731 RepID=UPI001872EC37|nr:Ras modification protein ERF4 [Colletotrichum aenigma]KAF5521080.1 Ras modification protein ERF4 [Colletotrichum aenigma]